MNHRKTIVLFNFRMDADSRMAFAIDWVNAIAEHFETVHVVTLRSGRYNVRDNVMVHNLNRDSTNRIFLFFQLIKLLYKLNKKTKIAGYFIHMAYFFVPFAYIFSKINHQRSVLWYAHKSTSLTLKLAVKLVDKIFSVSSDSFRIRTSKFKAIGHGIDTENRFYLRNPKKEVQVKRLLMVGRISTVKNNRLVLEALASLHSAYPEVTLTFAGEAITDQDKQYQETLFEYIGENSLENVVNFIGLVPIESLPNLYSEYDAAINISDTGSLDKTVIEPLAMGIPVITSNESAYTLFRKFDNHGVFLTKKSTVMNVLEKVISKPAKNEYEKIREEVEKHYSLKQLAEKIAHAFK